MCKTQNKPLNGKFGVMEFSFSEFLILDGFGAFELNAIMSLEIKLQ